MHPTSRITIRRATVADAERLMVFGRKAFDDTFTGHPKNAPEDMKLYMDEAFTVEQFENEIGNYHLSSSSSPQKTEGNGMAPQPKNIFLIMEEEEGEKLVQQQQEEKGDEDDAAAAAHHNKSTTSTCTTTIVAYAKLCVDAIEEGIILGDNLFYHQNVQEPIPRASSLREEAVQEVQKTCCSGDDAILAAAEEEGKARKREDAGVAAADMDASRVSGNVRRPQRAIELGRLYVDKEHVGARGLGSRLMEECYRVALEEEGFVKGDVMWLGVWEYNFVAQRFYEKKHGFRFVGQHVFQLGNDPQIDLLMQKEL